MPLRLHIVWRNVVWLNSCGGEKGALARVIVVVEWGKGSRDEPSPCAIPLLGCGGKFMTGERSSSGNRGGLSKWHRRDETGLIVMPIFYDVDPSQVRKQNPNFGKALAKQVTLLGGLGTQPHCQRIAGELKPLIIHLWSLNTSMAFSAASSSNSTPPSSSRSWKYDVFLSFRGEDTRKTFVDHLYSTLTERLIRVYKDDETLPRGDSIGQSLLKAIEESRIAVVVFSKNYAESSWCLDELAYIMKCKAEEGLMVMPIFYDVDPSQVRKQQGDFGKAFAKQETKNINKVESWRKALLDASSIAGWEHKNIANGHESKVIKNIVGEIQNRLLALASDVNEELVGMTERLQDLMSQLEIGTGGVRMVGIWGIGGSGKTTLASSVYTEISHHFHGHCFIANIREKSKRGLETLQQKILSTLLKSEVEVHNVQQGKYMIKNSLCYSKVLIILDDVDYLGQLQALAGSPRWFGSGSRIIITTRDEHLLKTHRVDHVTPIRLLSDKEAIRLFYKHAYNEKEPLTEYETLSSRVVSYAAGLPLALKVLGSFLFDKDKKEWISALAKLKDIPDIKIMDILRISYDGLETLQKELFLDIACFFRWKSIADAMEILDACGFYPVIEIKVLTQKALITTTDGKFDMHDLVQQMGQYIVRGEHPNDPEKHSRVWKNEEISNMCYGDSTMENDKIEAMRYYGHSSHLFDIISNMKKLRWLSVVVYLGANRGKHTEGPSFLSNNLRYLYWERYPASPFPDNFQLSKLVVLKLYYSLQKELWNGYKRRPHLKVLQLCYMEKLLRTPDFNGLPYLQKLEISSCDKLKKIHPSLGNHTSLEFVSVRSCENLRMFPLIVEMKSLKTLEIENCYLILELPKIQLNIQSLVTLSMNRIRKRVLPSSVGECYIQPETVVHEFTRKLNLSSLQKLDLSGWGLKDGEIPSDIGEISSLEELHLSRNDFSQLDFSLSQLTRLKILILSECKWLVELPELPSCIAVLEADYCDSLITIGNNCHTDFKCLCEVSLLRNSHGIVNDAGRLVESMLQGMGIPKVLRPRNRRRMQLPENWCNDFCGFIMCFFTKYSTSLSCKVGMSNEIPDEIPKKFSFISYYEVSLERSIGGERTWVAFVSFASLRHTSWWEETQNTLSVSFHEVLRVEGLSDMLVDAEFEVALVPKKSGIAPTEISRDFPAYHPLNIVDYSTSRITIEISFCSNHKSGKSILKGPAVSIGDDQPPLGDGLPREGDRVGDGEVGGSHHQGKGAIE
uniref:disease resistance protein Roq1-like n=1 Tax=Erigeron canadensis TaxID=72917 RepID=UPI001CB9AFAB|nr:disease resistance protein Roq1-like [Erigeron canadensis]